MQKHPIPSSPKFKDLTNRDFGRLHVLYYCGVNRKPCGQPRHMWFCECSCGKQKKIEGGQLKSGKTLSCGCHKRDKINAFNYLHGKSKSPTWNSWMMMIQRCTRPNYEESHLYADRGISVCDRWMTFTLFLQDMGERPPGHTLDRFPNKDGNYEPGNCRWATVKQQARNMRTNHLLTHQGMTLTIAEWADKTGFKSSTIHARISSGWSVSEALTLPPTKGANQFLRQK